MKLRDKTLILETLEETKDVCHGPTMWDGKIGGVGCAEYAAYFYMNVSESECKKGYSIDFATQSLSNYWDNLVAEGSRRELSMFDFDSGVEIDSSLLRDSGDMYLMAAKHISSKGIDAFALKHISGDDYQGVEFTWANGNTFVFKDTIDSSLYWSALKHLNELEDANSGDHLMNELTEFMKDTKEPK
jgi:hypothetical protein